MAINQILVGTATPTNVRNAKPVPALIVRGGDPHDLRIMIEKAIETISRDIRRAHPIRIQTPHQPPTRDAEVQIMPAHHYDEKVYGGYYRQIEAYLRINM